MTYVSWASFHEGPSDALYFDVLLPRLMEDIVTHDGIRHSDIPLSPALDLGSRGRTVDAVAREACDARAAFEIVFIHADTGGRALVIGLEGRASRYCEHMHQLCAWPFARCITMTPRHETEAWILADPSAVTKALGYRGSHRDLQLPNDALAAEALVDPKAVLKTAMTLVAGRRRRSHDVSQLFPTIAQRQDFTALRGSRSFRDFEKKLKNCLADLGCIPARSDLAE